MSLQISMLYPYVYHNSSKQHINFIYVLFASIAAGTIDPNESSENP